MRRVVRAFACGETLFKTLKRNLESLDGKYAAAQVRQSVFIQRLPMGPLMGFTQGTSLNGVNLMYSSRKEPHIFLLT
jgi:hypothetical protein